MKTNKNTVKLLSEIDSIIDDIQVRSILINDKTINLLFSEKITGNISEFMSMFSKIAISNCRTRKFRKYIREK